MASAAPRPIGLRLRRAMERKRLDQKQVAKALGVSRSAVNAWMNDRAYPLNSIGALEELLEVDLTDDDSSQQPVRSEPPAAEEPLEIPPDLQEYIDNLSDRQRELFIDALRAGQRYRRSRSEGRRRSAG